MARHRDGQDNGTSVSGNEESNRRAELVRVAGRLFRENGYEATPVRDIAAAAGMRSGSPFYHFKSKQDLLKAVMAEGLNKALQELTEAVAGKPSAIEAFRAIVRTHLAIILEPGADFVPVLLYEWRSLACDGRAEIVAIKDRYEAVWQDVLRDLKREGLIRDDSPIGRLFVFGALNWVARWYCPHGSLSIDAIADRAVEFFIGPPNRR